MSACLTRTGAGRLTCVEGENDGAKTLLIHELVLNGIENNFSIVFHIHLFQDA